MSMMNIPAEVTHQQAVAIQHQIDFNKLAMVTETDLDSVMSRSFIAGASGNFQNSNNFQGGGGQQMFAQQFDDNYFYKQNNGAPSHNANSLANNYAQSLNYGGNNI